MTIDKAINYLSAIQEDYEGGEYPNEENALKLGVEALKRVKQCRFPPYGRIEDTLPSETK